MKDLETKKEIRKQILKLRAQMDPQDWAARTATIAQRVISDARFREATDLFCYMDIRQEVGTGQIIEEAWRLGKTVWLPRVEGEDMSFYAVGAFEELKAGAWGIPEPKKDAGSLAPPQGLMLVPGAAFDKKCRRIGYGRGFYDRYLAAHPMLDTIGLAFDIQILERLPVTDQDVSLRGVLTETLMLEG